MKTRILTLALLGFPAAGLHAAPVIRSAGTDALNSPAAWEGGATPAAANTATWNAASALENTMGAGITWGALDTSAASAAVAIAGANTLLLDHATDADTVFHTGANDFIWGTPGIGGNFNIRGTAPNTSTAPGATFSGSGTVTIGGTGTKNWSSDGGTNGVTAVSFTGTLALRGAAIPAIGALPGNWLAFGGGGGDLVNPGSATQTGSFALDLGDETSCGSFILTHGFNDRALQLRSLRGSGSIRSDWGIGAPLSTRTIELDQAGSTTLSGSLLAHNGSGQRRNVHFVKKGAGTITFAGALGTSGGTASLTFDLREGAIRLGDGGATPTFVGGLDTAAATFAIAGGTELVFQRAGFFNWPYIHSGAGTIRLADEAGEIAFTGASPSFAGDVRVDQGILRLGPSLASATVHAETDSIIAPGLPGAAAESIVGTLVLKDRSETDYRLGASHDKITVTTPGGLTPPGPGGVHSINIFNEPVAGGTITLIDYQGAPLSAAEFARFKLGILPFLGDYELVHNTANTSIDLRITLPEQIWKGFASGVWDDAAQNWALATAPATPAAFSMDNPAVFDDSASLFAVEIGESGVFPLSIAFNNAVNDYTLTGGAIAGTATLAKSGAAMATLVQDNSHSGGTTVIAGTLRIGDGGSDGDIGGGAVQVAADATLAYHLDATQVRDYKVVPKMRAVSGAGDIRLGGGFTFFNYTGAGVGFNEANSWRDFSGRLIVTGGSEFRTIRNGRTAMGSAGIVLGDAATSGHLAQIEGNWTWTNDIHLAGPANEIRNRSAIAPRTLKLQGVISGDGGLVFSDPAASMTNIQAGFILTGGNTLGGTLTINPGVPVRIGGVPGDADILQSGPGTGGSLGSASVLNEGTLTFSRSDSHTLANDIAGGGAVFIGLEAGNTEQVMTYAGTATHTGGTTVRAGTLVVAPAGSIGGPSLAVADGARLVIDGSSIGDAAALLLDASALVEITGTESVGSLFIGGAQLAAGSYGASGSGAANTDDVRFAGSGVLLVANDPPPATGYAGWAAENAPSGGPYDDFDGDGVTNAIEYVLGGSRHTNDLDKLPSATIRDDAFVFSFIRDQASKTPDILVTLEAGNTLATWPDVFIVGNDTATSSPGATITDHGDGTETITLTLTRAPHTKRFARLVVEVR